MNNNHLAKLFADIIKEYGNLANDFAVVSKGVVSNEILKDVWAKHLTACTNSSAAILSYKNAFQPLVAFPTSNPDQFLMDLVSLQDAATECAALAETVAVYASVADKLGLVNRVAPLWATYYKIQKIADDITQEARQLQRHLYTL